MSGVRRLVMWHPVSEEFAKDHGLIPDDEDQEQDEPKPPPTLMIGPAKAPGEVGLEPPMLETRARRQHADQLRQQYRERRQP